MDGSYLGTLTEKRWFYPVEDGVLGEKPEPTETTVGGRFTFNSEGCAAVFRGIPMLAGPGALVVDDYVYHPLSSDFTSYDYVTYRGVCVETGCWFDITNARHIDSELVAFIEFEYKLEDFYKLTEPTVPR